MHVLIVDNDAFSKANAKIALQHVGPCDDVDDCESALARITQGIESGEPYRLILVDIEATDTENHSFLTELRALEDRLGVSGDSQARIFVASSLSGRQWVTDCLIKGCDEVFTKPLDRNHLLSKLDSHGLLPGMPASAGGTESPGEPMDPATILDKALKGLKKGNLHLPPAPKIAMRLRQLLDCDAEIKDVVALLEQDLSVATNLISVANSAFYRGIEKSATLAQATQRLGLTRIREVVMSICCRGYFVTNHPVYKAVVENLWWHSLACAHTADMIAQKKAWRVDDDIFSIGLLHDIGKLYLVQVAGDLQQRNHRGCQPVDLAGLRSLMDDHHARLGASMLEQLGYPEGMVTLVRRHHRMGDDQTQSRSLTLIQEADLLAKAAGFGLEPEPPESIRETLLAWGMDEEAQGDATREIVLRMEQLRYVFG